MSQGAITARQLYELQAALTRVCTLSAGSPDGIDRPSLRAFTAEALGCGAMYAVVGMAVVAAERFDLVVQVAEREGVTEGVPFPTDRLRAALGHPSHLDEREVQTCLDLVMSVTSGPVDHPAVWSLIRAKGESAFLVLLAIADALGVMALEVDPSWGPSLIDLVRREALRRELDWLDDRRGC